MRFGVGEGIKQLFSNFLGKTLACFKRKSYLCFIKRNINNIGIMKQVDFSNFTPQEQREYEASKMAYRDIKNSIDTAKREGKEEGLAEGMEKGLAEGMEKGLAEGMEKGLAEGMEKGLAEGMEKGLAEGMEKGLAEGMEKGLAEGMERGMTQRSLEIARKMLANGMDAATVMEITGLSAEEILLLKREK